MAVPREEIYGYLRDAVGWVGSNSCRSCAATPEKDRLLLGTAVRWRWLGWTGEEIDTGISKPKSA